MIDSGVDNCCEMWRVHKAHILGGRRELYEWPGSVVTHCQEGMKVLLIKCLR